MLLYNTAKGFLAFQAMPTSRKIDCILFISLHPYDHVIGLY